MYVPEEGFEEAPESGPEEVTYYTIQPGDNLKSVAERFGITEETLIQLNQLANPDKILSGQRLKVPNPPAAKDSGGAEPAGETPTPETP